MNYKNAFNCKKCPESNGENGCPNWWEMVMTNHLGEQKVEKKCGYQMMPQLIIQMCKMTEHTTYAAYDMRNKTVENINKVISAIHQKFSLPEPELDNTELLPFLEEQTKNENA
jgi:hypothetical protein